MSIKFKLLAGCLLLTAITVLLGAFTQASQHRIGSVGIRIYDEAFMAVSYLRASQNGLLKLRAASERIEWRGQGRPDAAGAANTAALLATALPEILDDLRVARDRAISPEGRAATVALEGRLKDLASILRERGSAALLETLDQIQSAFDTAVEVYAGDGFGYRRTVERLIDASLAQTLAATGAAAALAILITLLLGRSIVPAVQNAVRIAQSISDGKLDNPINARGRDETARLLRALATMQASIANRSARINALADQAANQAAALALQSGRFEAALNNMTQGLCLFDASGRLAVYNRRFAEMFGAPTLGSAADAVRLASGAPVALERRAGASVCHDMPDGRVIAASQQPIAEGGWVETYEDVTERRRAEVKLAYMARHDALTGLANRVVFRERLEAMLADAQPGRSPAVLCLDLDGFKAVNDTLGHPVGDKLLRAVAQRLLESVGATDVVARLGGDEFAIVQDQGASPADAEGLARRLVEILSTPFEIDGRPLAIGASVGVACGRQEAGGSSADEADVMLRNADLALYHAKAEGRGAYSFFAPEMDARLQARLNLERDLRSALDQGQFELFFQPVVSTERGRVSAFEALLRWRHPQHGMISPATFIPLAEETGLIKSIGQWVLRRACLDAATWPPEIKVAVNISPAQFRSRFLAADVVQALAASGLAPGRLELEITESVLLQDDDAVLVTLHQIRQLGVGISLDDFGTGYSSLIYLRKFPFDKLKIDRSFIQDISGDGNMAIVRAVLRLGQALNITIVAEGVETPEQLDILATEGCSEVQGYLFSPPKPASHVGELIDRLTSSVQTRGSRTAA